MSIFVFCLVIFTAFLHALWNFITKKVSGNLSILYISLWVASIIFFPVALFLLPSQLETISENYIYLILTGVINASYFFTLSKAYKYGDISTVYPIARGTGIVGTAITAFFLLQEDISKLGLVGISMIFCGTLLIGLKKSIDLKHNKGVLIAPLVGLFLTLGFILDKVSVSKFNPIFYIFFMCFFSVLFLTPYILKNNYQELVHSWKNLKKYGIIIGIASMGNYLIILHLFKIASVSYIVATRELSVVIGSILGVKLLGEKMYLKKALGILCVAFGMIMIKMGS